MYLTVYQVKALFACVRLCLSLESQIMLQCWPGMILGDVKGTKKSNLNLFNSSLWLCCCYVSKTLSTSQPFFFFFSFKYSGHLKLSLI